MFNVAIKVTHMTQEISDNYFVVKRLTTIVRPPKRSAPAYMVIKPAACRNQKYLALSYRRCGDDVQ